MDIMGETYSNRDLVAEVGRGILFLLAAAGWTYFILLLMVD
jgi:hypothetical protein